MTTIDPDTHADLIRLRREATAAHATLLAYHPRGGPDTPEQAAERQRLRAAAFDASTRVHDATLASGLVQEHGYHQVNVDLRNAAR